MKTIKTHGRRQNLPFEWPSPPLQVALVEPEIPPNTGNIARLCAATGTPLHLIGRLGFHLHNAALRRAGLDYWDSVSITRHADINVFFQAIHPARCFFFSAGASQSCFSTQFYAGDILVFGSESRGLPDELLAACPEMVLGIPIRPDHVRSLNLSSAVAIALYEALRQITSRHDSATPGAAEWKAPPAK